MAAAVPSTSQVGLRLVMHYDIMCPNSWVFYQVLQKKIKSWRKEFGTERRILVDFAPMLYPLISQKTFGLKPASMLLLKKQYLAHELHEVCDFYGLEKADFHMKPDHLERRNYATLLFLNNLRRFKLDFYERFLYETWHQFWHAQESVGLATDLLKIGRRLGIPFRVLDDLVMRTEEIENRIDMNTRFNMLTIEDRIVNSPWLRICSGATGEKLFGFSDILRLELLDELVHSGALFDDQELSRFSNVINKEAIVSQGDQDFMDLSWREKKTWQQKIEDDERADYSFLFDHNFKQTTY